MVQRTSRRSVLIGIGTLGIFSSLSGATAASDGEVRSAHQLADTTTAANRDLATVVDPVPKAAPERTIAEAAEGATNSQLTVSQSQSEEVAITVSDPDSGSIPSGGTVNVWAGLIDTESEAGDVGISDAELTIEIGRPDRETDEFTETTDASGSVTVSYSVPDTIVGGYAATVTAPDGTQATTSFTVGPVLEPTTQRFRSRPVLTGQDATFRFLVRDGRAPLANEDVALTLRDTETDSTLSEDTETTNADGFAEYTVGALDPGAYTVEATATVEGVELAASISFPVSEIGYEYDFFRLDDLLAGREAAQGGRMWTGDGPLANTEVELQYRNDEAGVNITETTTTDDNGFFVVRFDAPTDVEELSVAAGTTDGRSAALGSFEDSVDVNQPPIEEDPDPEAEVDANFDEFRIAPGDTATLEITATDDADEPIANTPVSLIARFGFSGNGAPLISTTAETDANGEATVDVPIPVDAPDGSRLNASLSLEHDGETLSDDDSTTIQSIDSGRNQTVEDGDIEVTLDAVETGTDNPVSDHNVYIDSQYISGRTGSIFGRRLTSGADGSAIVVG